MDSERIAEMSRHINQSAMRLYRLIENFLVYTHTEMMLADRRQAQTLQNQFVVYPKSSIEHAATHKAEQTERERDLQLYVRDVEAVAIGEDYLRKIIEELVDNAFKFSSSGTPVFVSSDTDGSSYLITV